jgi:transcriptional regulator with XRE-family HTH domain
MNKPEHPIATKRKALGMTQTALGKVLEVSLHTISRWETGERTPRRHHLHRLRDLLGLTADDILAQPPTAAAAPEAGKSEAPQKQSAA